MDIAKYWKTIVDTLPDGLMVIDPTGCIQALNPAAEKLTGYGASELIGNSCRMLNCTGCDIYARGAGKDWCSLFHSGEVRAKRCMISHKEGHAIHIVKNASVLWDAHGQMIGAVETLTDMSENVRQQMEIESLRKTFHLDNEFHGIVGKSAVMQTLFELIEHVALTEAPVMITGESGTGKELVARAVHDAGGRCRQPFIKVNCAALNENLLESELFGHVKGAFTGADRTRIGRFEAAHQGTIFLDEIGDIPPSIQVKLLRVLEGQEVERVGDHRPIPVDVRVVTATNKDLESLIARGRFREDLFFRINVFPLRCPALRERREDLPMIVQSFIQHSTMRAEKKILGLTPAAMQKFLSYHWPGNVREVRNAIDYAFVLCPGGWIGVEHLPPKVSMGLHTQAGRRRQNSSWDQERQLLVQVLRQTGGNQSRAARLLDVSRVTVWKRIRKFGIDLHAELINS